MLQCWQSFITLRIQVVFRSSLIRIWRNWRLNSNNLVIQKSYIKLKRQKSTSVHFYSDQGRWISSSVIKPWNIHLFVKIRPNAFLKQIWLDKSYWRDSKCQLSSVTESIKLRSLLTWWNPKRTRHHMLRMNSKTRWQRIKESTVLNESRESLTQITLNMVAKEKGGKGVCQRVQDNYPYHLTRVLETWSK